MENTPLKPAESATREDSVTGVLKASIEEVRNEPSYLNCESLCLTSREVCSFAISEIMLFPDKREFALEVVEQLVASRDILDSACEHLSGREREEVEHFVQSADHRADLLKQRIDELCVAPNHCLALADLLLTSVVNCRKRISDLHHEWKHDRGLLASSISSFRNLADHIWRDVCRERAKIKALDIPQELPELANSLFDVSQCFWNQIVEPIKNENTTDLSRESLLPHFEKLIQELEAVEQELKSVVQHPVGHAEFNEAYRKLKESKSLIVPGPTHLFGYIEAIHQTFDDELPLLDPLLSFKLQDGTKVVVVLDSSRIDTTEITEFVEQERLVGFQGVSQQRLSDHKIVSFTAVGLLPFQDCSEIENPAYSEQLRKPWVGVDVDAYMSDLRDSPAKDLRDARDGGTL